jgi:CRP/FNR family transcriptional regulator, cyclic AMP receptor protein
MDLHRQVAARRLGTVPRPWGENMDTPPSLSPRERDTLMSNAWFAGLPEAVRSDIVSCAHRRELAAAQRLHSRGDRADGVFGVLVGTLRLSGINQDGKETILDFYGPGQWVGEVSVLDGGPRIHDADVCEDAVLLQLKAQDLEHLLARHAPLSRMLLRLEAQRLRILMTAIESYSTQSLAQRLAARLLMLAEGHGMPTPAGVVIDLPLSQETLARLIGSTRQRIAQVLKDWECEGVIRRRDGCTVLTDEARLEAVARL